MPEAASVVQDSNGMNVDDGSNGRCGCVGGCVCVCLVYGGVVNG